MTDPINPFLEDDDEATHTPVRAFPILQRRSAEESHAPRWGEKGYRKGVPNPHKGTPRARVTETTAPLLAFLSKFPASTAEAVSMVSVAQPAPGHEGGGLRSTATTMRQLEKLKKLGMVSRFKAREADAPTYWDVTGLGLATAHRFGYLQTPHEGSADALASMSLTRLEHYRYIGLVAARYTCPVEEVRKETGVERVPMSDLIGERQIRADFADTEWELKAAKREGKPSDWGTIRKAMLQEALAEVQAGHLPWSELLTAYPLLRVLGASGVKLGNGRSAESYHIPDLVIHRDGLRKDKRAHNLLIEVELSRKNWDYLKRLFKLYAFERQYGLVYEGVRYYTDNNSVANLLQRVDKSSETGLIESGFLTIHPLKHLNGDLVKIRRQVRD